MICQRDHHHHTIMGVISLFNHAFFLSAAAAVVSISIPTCAANGVTCGCDDTSDSFSYLLLVAQWPGSWGVKDARSFTLHGLWPSREGAAECSYPCTCTAEKFDQSKIGSILPQMTEFWPSSYPPNAPFWSHEWTKHGTCSGFQQLEYFSTTLSWLQKTNASLALKKKGIVPGSTYSASDIASAIDAANGAAPLLGCDRSSNSLTTVSFCLNVDATKLVECDSSIVNAGGNINSCDRSKPILFNNGAATPTRSPTAPSPGAKKCLKDKKGPPCSSNADCVDFPDCVRCAKSGFCTQVPLVGTEDDAGDRSAAHRSSTPTRFSRNALFAAALFPFLL